MARVVVTGSAGLIGGLVVDALRLNGDVVVCIDRPHEERLVRGRNVDDKGAFERLDHACDLTEIDVESLAEWMLNVDAVIHLAADANPSNWNLSMLQSNLVATQNVLEAAVRAGVGRVLLASSGLVQVGLEKHLQSGGLYENQLISIEHGVSIDSPYGLTKIIVEQMGRKFAEKFSIEIISTRIGTVIPDDREHWQRGGRLQATAFLHEDVRRYFLSALNADLSQYDGHIITAAQSNSPTRFIDLEPGISCIDWKPLSWPDDPSELPEVFK